MDRNFTDDTFLSRWINGDLSEEEQLAFQAHEDFELYKKIAETTADFQLPERNKRKTWEALEKQLGDQEKISETTNIRQIRSWWKYAAACLLLMIVGYVIWFQQSDIQTYATAKAEQQTHTLPDRSIVVMNADSKIIFNKNSFEKERKLSLEGEAFFDVQAGSVFIVETTNGNVRVLGTSFNIRSRTNKIEVSCLSGKVALEFDDNTIREVVNPGERVLAQNSKIINKSQGVDKLGKPSWLTGNTKFDQVEFIEVVSELERQFDVEINYPAELTSLPKYSGGFSHSDLQTALRIVFEPVGYRYEVVDKTITVFK